MGSMVTLGVGPLEIDWGKNEFFRNHSKLFLPTDIKQIPYYYADNYVVSKEGYARPLKDVKRRLDMLGYSIPRLKSLYEEMQESWRDLYDEHISFDEFYQCFVSIDLNKINVDEDGGNDDFGEFVSRHILRQPEIRNKISCLKKPDCNHRALGEMLENVDPYILLRILAQNAENDAVEVQWRYADILDGGWAEESEIYEGLEDQDRWLIVTEGSSDSFVFKRAIKAFSSDISDFFCFVDMKENYPFSGTGNLYRFCQGLSSIRIQNKVLVIYDNDTDGGFNYERTRLLPLPNTMRVIKLPNHGAFVRFPTTGPQGLALADINGMAVSIECFLDLTFGGRAPVVRWSGYNEGVDKYQGALVDKEKYLQDFKSVAQDNPQYDFSKIRFLVTHIYEACL